MNMVTLPDFLTDEQIEQAVEIVRSTSDHLAARKLQVDLIEPNMAEINRKLGQENDSLYLAYAVLYVVQQVMRQ